MASDTYTLELRTLCFRRATADPSGGGSPALSREEQHRLNGTAENRAEPNPDFD
jgi:hypothetical protein